MTKTPTAFKHALTCLINTYSIETITNIPDHMLADYFCETTDVLATAVKMTNRMVTPGVTRPMSLFEACHRSMTEPEEGVDTDRAYMMHTSIIDPRMLYPLSAYYDFDWRRWGSPSSVLVKLRSK